MTQTIPNNKIDLPKESVAWQPCKLGKNLVIGANCTIGALAHIGSEVIIETTARFKEAHILPINVCLAIMYLLALMPHC